MWRLLPFAPVLTVDFDASNRGHIPQFAYPGGKCRLARRIVSLFPAKGDRFVDAFAGRGNITWAVMQLCTYKKHWLNDLQRLNFFRALKQKIIPYIVPESNRQLYKDMRRLALDYPELAQRTDVQLVHASMADITCMPNVIVFDYPWAWVKHKADPREPAFLLEPYLCFAGGTYAKHGTRTKRRAGGVSQSGYARNVGVANILMSQKYTKITNWDYRKVLEQCGPSDMVYL